jgi:hypothetical protein
MIERQRRKVEEKLGNVRKCWLENGEIMMKRGEVIAVPSREFDPRIVSYEFQSYPRCFSRNDFPSLPSNITACYIHVTMCVGECVFLISIIPHLFTVTIVAIDYIVIQVVVEFSLTYSVSVF